MSEEKQKLDEARHLWDNAIEAIEQLRYLKEETLREISKSRTRMPVIVFGQKGRIGKGITVVEYTKDLGLGSELLVKADLPKGWLKTYILEYIDRVSMLKAGEEPKKKIANPTQEEIDHGIVDNIQDELNNEWLQDVNAFRLPSLSKKTLTIWAEQISYVIQWDADRYADYEVAEIDGKEQRFSTGFPLEIDQRISKNYNKLLRRKIRRAEDRAELIARKSRIKGLEGQWQDLLTNKAKSKTFLMDFEASSVREAVGDILNSIVIVSP